MLCSSCSRRPTQSPLYKTCPACREKAHRQRTRLRSLDTGTTEAPTSHSSVQRPPLSTTIPSPIEHVVCSVCGRPWQSPRFKTCDRCRRWKKNYRRRIAVSGGLMASENANTSREGFSIANISDPRATSCSSPIASTPKIPQKQASHDRLGQALTMRCDGYDRQVVAPQSFNPHTPASEIRDSEGPQKGLSSFMSIHKICEDE